ncbi:ribonuclease Z, mitochondrial isoform X2 [Anthonomus grandis grandis]|uniref:ribonuclease Z, mitochondrial isoform X2 n=1 Tax=Anthonomus grandis grandis TaxID=2921223 RepID=UPI002164FCCF|nr:ribonuclease Z, mitochondrial isoform X2 [Anthonomus grandis grandis]
MPKEPKHIVEAQKQRIKIKQKNSKYVPGRVTLQILGTGAKGAPRSVYLFSDQNRYLFNCGEGTQRLAHEHKTKLAKLEHIFITHPSWKNIGGLPGTALTIQDVGVPEITLHGPEGLNEIFPATRRFVVLRDLKVKVAECTENNHFEDNVMSVKYVPICKNVKIDNDCSDVADQDVQATVDQNEVSTSTRSTRKRSRRRSSSRSSQESNVMEDNTDYYAHEQSGKRTIPENIESITQSLLKETKEKNVSMCYVCRLQPRPGALSLDKCVKSGVRPGPILGRLKNGEDVTLPNGTVVKSKDVCEPDDPGPIFIVVDCPSPDYIQSLATNLELSKHQNSAQSDEDLAALIVHFTSKEVMELPDYQQWMDKFSPSTVHIPVNELNSCMGSVAVHRIQYKLNLLSEDFFPLLRDHGTPDICEAVNHQTKRQKCDDVGIENLKINGGSKLEINDLTKNHNLEIVGCLSSYHLRPKQGIDSSSRVQLDPQEYINEITSLEDFPNALAELKQTVSFSKSQLRIREHPKVIFLGTGSCIPNKTRNTSGILLQTSESNIIIMDCGEGTCGQIIRFFGPEKGDEVLSNIKAVYISHLHADHHIGLIGLIQGRKKAMERLKINPQPLYLFAPQQILTWLYFYDRCFEEIEDQYELVPNGELIFNQNSYPIEKKNEILNNLEFCDISTCLVKHCPNAFGVSVIHKSGYKITYSGDTMPCEQLVELGKNSDVLIHEATMEDELEKEALIKLHSTTSQAIQVGKDMQAKNIILTHFSQRYAKLPRFNDNFAANVSIAFDNMQIRLDELPLVPLMYPALKVMFAEDCEEMETKSAKRQLKSERQASLDRSKMEQNS